MAKRHPTRRRAPTGRRKWWFRLMAATLVPAACLLLLELGLTLAGYGTARSFFTMLPGGRSYTTNQQYGWRFFLPVMARQPVPCELPATKADNAFRIFILGGSAAQGTPERAFAFGRILQVMLERNYPQTKFEVVNAAMTAINSHVVRQIAADCAKLEPDLFIVYMGNNEVVGPYGPGTVFAGFSGSLTAIRWSIQARSTRIGQLLRNAAANLRGSNSGAWRGMRMFTRFQLHADDPRLADTYAHFRQNLLDICDMAARSGARVIVSTVASNLKDNPPFASLHRADLTQEQLAQWQALYASGIALEQAGDHTEAIKAYDAAAAIDDRYAELPYRLGRCYLALGEYENAKASFTSARDQDALRFRADTQINQIIRKVTEQARGGVQLVDAEAALAQRSAALGGIIGSESFHEHVHLNFAGNYAIAAAMFKAITENAVLPATIRSGRAPVVPSMQACARSLALSDWALSKLRHQMFKMTAQAPFVDQLDHHVAQAKRQVLVNKTIARLASRSARQAALDLHTAALAARPKDLELARMMAMLLSDSGDHAAAARQWRALLERIPGYGRWQFELGTSLVKQGAAEEAVAVFEQGLEVLPDDLAGQVNLGIALMQSRDLDAAVARFVRVLSIEPDHFTAQSNLGLALLALQRYDEATEHMRKALELDDENAGAHFNLGLALQASGKPGEAAAAFGQALKRDPNHSAARSALKSVRAQLGAESPPSP